MIEEVARGLVLIATVYVAVGVAVAVPFVLRGVQTIDPAARSASLAFRLLILPGSVALWPLLLQRWLRKTPPPIETNAHRARAGTGAART